MKATDLMLGDWVLCDLTPYQIAEISAGLLCIDAERELFATPEDIRPIPLTPEILEKNNITAKRAEEIYVFYNSDDFCITPNIDSNRKMCWMFYCGRKEHDANICIYFVHQLQHALRLCGIEKEVVL